MKIKILGSIFLFCCFFSLQAQTTSSTTALPPEPYDLTKIPQGILDLRRFEIIMFGAMPVVYLFSEIITSTALYAKYKTPDYIPLVGTGELKNNEKMYTVGVTFSLAFIVATVDMILYKKKMKEEAAGEERRLRVRRANELYGGTDEEFQPQSTDSLTDGDSASENRSESISEEEVP